MAFIPGSLEDTDKYIEVADGHHVTEKQKGQVQIKMCNDNRNTFIATLHKGTFSTRLMQQVIFDHYVTEFRTYLSFSQKVLHSVLRNKEEKMQ